MLNPQNQKDKDRFEKLKEAQVERGRDEQTATEVAASEVKEMRRREGRDKDEQQ
jgi:hypothetical protein